MGSIVQNLPDCEEYSNLNDISEINSYNWSVDINTIYKTYILCGDIKNIKILCYESVVNTYR